MISHFDTIVALITGSQPAAVAVIRLSGSDAWPIAAKVFLAWPQNPETRRATYGRYVTGDDGLALPFAEDHSYTGEQSVELSCHGSPASVRALIEACIVAGARMARAGEFTERAFLNGRIDLTEAEAVADTVNALTNAQLRVANRQRQGMLHKEISELRQRILKVLGAVEATVDFEEEVGPLDRSAMASEIHTVIARLEEMLKHAEIGHLIRHGLRVAIVGPPNAGKSSLFNALVGHDRAIVTPVAGTTRDYLEEKVDVHGIPVVFIDTAGLRDKKGKIESIGIERSRAIAAKADLVWFVFDATSNFKPDLKSGDSYIANKADLLSERERENFLSNSFKSIPLVSAKTCEGLDRLLGGFAVCAEQAAALEIPPPSRRHTNELVQATAASLQAAKALEEDLPPDLLTTHLRAAADHLGEIIGETASADMIENIFSDFCIGK